MRWRALDFVNVSNLVNLTKQLKVADNAEPQVEKESCEERQKKSLEKVLLMNHNFGFSISTKRAILDCILMITYGGRSHDSGGNEVTFIRVFFQVDSPHDDYHDKDNQFCQQTDKFQDNPRQ